ncbi:hypothetical protein ILUMI_18610 [Ignelater luminosus]|uniref:Uncharacterized protein n=1 Tax=Ignelater luminosus TaxID=2038154 RepID=A0A8K0G6Q0_IGNLU|nr:hypothetical protein ILUMI_18610 [Ignelater luminosus]
MKGMIDGQILSLLAQGDRKGQELMEARIALARRDPRSSIIASECSINCSFRITSRKGRPALTALRKADQRPFEINWLTDEESENEDMEGDLDYLPPRQLLDEAEIKLKDNTRSDTPGEDHSSQKSSKVITKEKLQHKWIKAVFENNVWVLYTKAGHPMTQLQFRREVINIYFTKYGTSSRGTGRPAASLCSSQCTRISDDIQYDKIDHLLVYILDKKRRRCAMEVTPVRELCAKHVM